MNDCKRIRVLIEESERPGMISYEAERHISACADCKTFADERASLRSLIASAPRVSIPTNFDVVLRAKLDQSRRVKTFSWFSPAGFMQLGAATAGIIIAIAATQYMGIFSGAQQPVASRLNQNGVVPAPLANAEQSPSPSTPQTPKEIVSSDSGGFEPVASVRQRKRPAAYSTARVTERDDVDPGFVLLMGQDGETRVSVPTVGVGAQPLLMSGAPVSVSTVRTSF